MGTKVAGLVRILAVVGFIALLGLAAWQLYSLSLEAAKLKEMRLSLDSAMSGVGELETKLELLDEEIAKLGFVKINLYFMRMTETDIYIEPVRRVAEKDNLLLNAIRLLIAGPRDSEEGLYPVIPEGVEVLGAEDRDGIATVDFSNGILHAGYGSEAELAMVSAIVDTACDLPGISKVQILVEGGKVESLGGHVLVEEPLARMEGLLKN
jgi:spore germination protein GerM